MQTVNVKLKAGALKGIVDLPVDDDQLVNVTVSPEVEETKKITEKDFDDLLAEIKNFWAHRENAEDIKTFDEYRMERLEKKYGAFN
ncbi:MAG: hypothetical protein IKZ58_02000 [Selenomonadaceae bacterium]|nr:hypothetical protein [Selenomonadaceae bacterium]